jgi:hypothetical protein
MDFNKMRGFRMRNIKRGLYRFASGIGKAPVKSDMKNVSESKMKRLDEREIAKAIERFSGQRLSSQQIYQNLVYSSFIQNAARPPDNETGLFQILDVVRWLYCEGRPHDFHSFRSKAVRGGETGSSRRRRLIKTNILNQLPCAYWTLVPSSRPPVRRPTELANGASCSHFKFMSKLSAKLKEEFFALLPPTIFFFVALHIVMFVRVLMLKGTGISPLGSISVAVASLILGKSVLIADLLPWINRFPDKPLIYNIAWKTFIYMVVAAVIHYLERLIDFWRQAGGLVAGNKKLLAEIIWPHFWAVQIILFVLIVAYCTMHELVRLVGKEKMLRIFFGPMPIPQV